MFDYVENNNQDCNAKFPSWLNDKSVQLFFCKSISSSSDKLTAQVIVKKVKEYLKSNWVKN